MDNQEIPQASGGTGPEGPPPMDRESLAQRLREIEEALESNRVELNDLKEKLNQSITNCHRADMCKHDDHVICMKFAARVHKINTRLVIYRQNVLGMKNRIATIDRRRTVNDKLSHERQELSRGIVTAQEKFEHLERQLTTEGLVVDQLRARFRTVLVSVDLCSDVHCAELAYNTREETFAMAASLKRYRLTLTTERDKLLKLQEAQQNEN